ncbi:MAG: hypothetical protein FWH20_09380 [Oscillospiraceae bacterium]|nr:hypothetical protein [Oscillospiraceae bacterium]
MKKCLTIYIANLYLIYLIWLPFLLFNPPGNFFIIAWIVLLVLTFVTGNANIIYALVTRAKNRAGHEHGIRIIMKAKLALIPFYIFNFAFWLLVFGASANPFLMWTWVTIIPLAIIFACGVLVTTSIYSVIAIIDLKKQGVIKGLFRHFFVQFLFVFDVLSCVYLYIKKYKPQYGKLRTAFYVSLPITLSVVSVFVVSVIGGTISTFVKQIPQQIEIDGEIYKNRFHPGLIATNNLHETSEPFEVEAGRQSGRYERVYTDEYDMVKRVMYSDYFVAENQWQRAYDYYKDGNNFDYYCRITWDRGGSGETFALPDMEPSKFDKIITTGGGLSHVIARADKDEITQIVFYKNSKDGLFTTPTGQQTMFIIDGEFVRLEYHFGNDEMRVRKMPRELEVYVLGLLERNNIR